MLARKPPREPEFWRSGAYSNGLQPVVGVSVFEALAYVNWLNHIKPLPGQRFALPLCAQWEAAARGTQGRKWPWGDDDPSDTLPRMNHSRDTRVGATSPVGLWPDGATPDGLFDLAGQVWEWSLSAWKGTDDGPALLETAADGDAKYRAVRGGAWDCGPEYCRPAFRFGVLPSNRDDGLGFRLLLCPIQFPGS